MSRIFNSAEELIGKTPLLRLEIIEREYGLSAKLIAKLEMLNPAGSVKDRAALYMINEAERSGKLKKGSVIIEPTSGNTGIGLSMVAAIRGYKAMIVMPDSMSPERIKAMEAYGAEVVLTDGKEGMAGAIRKAEELSRSIPDSMVAGQFDNPANAKAHYDTTGPEIYEDTDGEVDIFVCGIGTGGTVTGTGRFLREKKAEIKIIGAEPSDSAVLSGEKAGPHKLQGIGAGFVPAVLDTEVYDEVVKVTADAAYEAARVLCKKEGILSGISSGAALAAALEVAKRPENKGKNVVVLLPDTGSRYFSTDLF